MASNRPNPTTNRAVATIVSLVLLLGVWAGAAALAGDEVLFPSPWRVGGIAWAEAASGALARHLLAMLGRVAAAFIVAMAIGCALGLWMGRRPGVNL